MSIELPKLTDDEIWAIWREGHDAPEGHPCYTMDFDIWFARRIGQEAARLALEAAAKAGGKVADALQELLEDSQHSEHADCEDGGYCPVRDGRQALRDYDDAIRALIASAPGEGKA